ncbi:MAG: DUF3488 and transglutaminase-like domain-containing protein, partial [Myxococcota bacterium]
LALAAILFGLAFRGALDLVIAAVSFASLVTAHRMLSQPDAVTDRQVLLASLLLISGAAALAGEIWYAACLFAFGVFACLALGLTVVEGPVERDEELPLRPVLRQVSLGVALALLGGVAFFILFPRLSWNVAVRRATPGLLGGTTGMTDRVRLGGGGEIKTSSRVVLRAQLEPNPRSERLERYWVGRYFDAFDGREWRGSGVPQPPVTHALLHPDIRHTEQARVELLPAYDARTLVGLERPLTFASAVALSTSGSAPAPLVVVPGEEVHFAVDAHAYRYVVYSKPGELDVPLTADERQRLTQLPAALDPRVRELAARLAGAETDPGRVARRLEQWLKSSLGYTLELPGEVSDPLADFLFVRREGHCEHFATALAVLLRTRGIPARVVGGFFGGERIVDRYVVRAGDAHAWVEAHVEGRGWVTLDATPEAGRGSQPIPVLARLVDLYERLEELWRSRVVDYSLIDQVSFVRNLVRPPRGQTAEEQSPQHGPTQQIPVRPLLAGLGAAVLTWLVWRRLARRLGQRPHPAAGFLDDVERRLERAHIARQEGEELEELSRRLSARGHRVAPLLEQITRRYLEARFGARPLPRAERRALLTALDERLDGERVTAQRRRAS